MEEMRVIAMIVIVGLAVLDDLYRGRIGNGIIVTGLLWGALYQVLAKGVLGLTCFWGGALLPVLLLAGVYYFRMIGAGDVKLLAVIGGFLGPWDVLVCMVSSILLGGLISLAIMISHHNFSQRLICFSEYMNDYFRNRRWSSYMEQVDEAGRFCFSVPVLLAVLWQVRDCLS